LQVSSASRWFLLAGTHYPFSFRILRTVGLELPACDRSVPSHTISTTNTSVQNFTETKKFTAAQSFPNKFPFTAGSFTLILGTRKHSPYQSVSVEDSFYCTTPKVDTVTHVYYILRAPR